MSIILNTIFNRVISLIDGHRMILDIVHELLGCAESQDVFHILYKLSDWGLIFSGDMEPQTVVYWQRSETAVRIRSLFETCAHVLQSLVPITPDDDFPIFCFAAIPDRSDRRPEADEINAGRTAGATLGSGFSQQQGLLAALGELVETMAATWVDRPICTRATVRDVGKNGLSPHQLLLVSNRQFQMRTYWRKRYGKRHRIPAPVSDTDVLDWVAVTAYPDETPCLIPAGYCFLNYPHDQKYLVADSNGCAAGPTRTEAIVSGFLELVERDAVAIWWYNRIRRSAIDLAIFNDAELNECVHWMDHHHRRFYALDLTHDYGIPVIAALSINNEDTDISMGFGANFDCLTAVKSAVREMMQVYSLKRIMDRQIVSGGIESLDRSARAFISWAGSDFARTYAHMRPHGMIRSLKTLAPLSMPEGSEAVRKALVALCRKKNQQLFVLDFPPPTADIAVVRVIAPGLRHFRTRFAPGRLYQVPVKMGWRTTPLREKDLIQVPILI